MASAGLERLRVVGKHARALVAEREMQALVRDGIYVELMRSGQHAWSGRCGRLRLEEGHVWSRCSSGNTIII